MKNRSGWNRQYQYVHRRGPLRGLFEGLLSIAIILCSVGLLIAALAPWGEAAAPEPVGGDVLQIYTRQLEPASPAAPAEPDQKEPLPEDSWELLLVNRWTPLPEDYTVQTVELRNGLRVDERCYPALQRMMDACRGEGLSPVICSAYRSRERQEELFSQRVDRLTAQGYSPEEAEREAGKLVAAPGASEHQTGLAVDIVDQDNQLLDESQEDTAVQKWLMVHSWEYGFILRYPQDKSELTGISYEPWHYRYVGRDNAERIYSSDICLEEYLELIF